MIKFLTPPSPESRAFAARYAASTQAARNLGEARHVAARVARRLRPAAAVEAPLDADQASRLASYAAPTYTQGGVPCNPGEGA